MWPDPAQSAQSPKSAQSAQSAQPKPRRARHDSPITQIISVVTHDATNTDATNTDATITDATITDAGPTPPASAAATNGDHPPEPPHAFEPAGGLVDNLAEPRLAIPGYDALSASQVVERLAGLSPDELAAVRHYEAGHRRRRTILGKIEQLSA